MNKIDSFSFDNDKLLDKYQPDFAIGYGSGVFAQAGYKKEEKPMVDLIFGANSTSNRHEMNLANNNEDYSYLARKLGKNFIERLQEKGAKIYYHPYITFDDVTIKYGVISNDALITDLKEWKDLYVAGRLHKPVHILQGQSEVEEAMKANYESAVNTALLLLPENFTEEQLYMAIAGISYTGDHRMQYGENPDKVKNIVIKNIEGFENIYKQIIASKSNILTVLNGKIQQATHPKMAEEVYNSLPKNLLSHTNIDSFENREALARELKKGIVSIVKSSSIAQSLKGILTAGTSKSITYVQDKLRKSKRT